MNTETIARRGRIALWGLVVFVAFQGVIDRYLMPREIYLQITRILAGDYADQSILLFNYPWTEGLHRLLGLTMMVLGMLQFDAGLRRRRPRIHRWMGRSYLVLAAVIGVTGLYLGLTLAFSGPQEQVFVVVVTAALLMLASRAWLLARRRDFVRHREWMIRTFALPMFIGLQRLYYVPLSVFTDWPDREIFAVAAWLAVASVMVTAEWWINISRDVRQPDIRIQNRSMQTP